MVRHSALNLTYCLNENYVNIAIYMLYMYRFLKCVIHGFIGVISCK